jgi:hypothetical protein
MKKQCNKFKIEEFQLLEELEAVRRKGHRWRLGLVWVIFLINVLWFGYLALYWSMDWQVDIKFPWNLLPLLLLLASVGLYAIHLPGKCPTCKNRMSHGYLTEGKHCIDVHYCPNCRIYGKTGVKL